MIYLARRYLGMSAKEWLTTPWWEQQVLAEGMERDGLISLGDPDDPDVATGALQAERIHQDGAATITERDYSYDLSEMDDMPESGFTLGTLG